MACMLQHKQGKEEGYDKQLAMTCMLHIFLLALPCLIMAFPIGCTAAGEVFGNSSATVPMRVGLGTIINASPDGSEKLLSSNGIWALLFQNWEDSAAGTSYCMAGVSYTKKAPGVMWSFNPQDPLQPILGSSCILNLSSDGVLSLRTNQGIVSQTNTSLRGVHSLVLRDDGNLVLESDDGQPLWQSYDEEAFLILPGGKHFTERDILYERGEITNTSNIVDFSVPGSFGMRLRQVAGVPHLLLFLRESMFVYYSLSPSTLTRNQSAAKDADYYVVIRDSIEFYYSSAVQLIGSIAGNLNVVPPPGAPQTAFFHAEDGHLQINYLRVKDERNVQYFDMPALSNCDEPFFCGGVYRMCDPSTSDCRCPPGFEENLTSTSSCAGSDGSQNMVPISVSFHPQISLSQVASTQDKCKDLCEANTTCKAALYDSNTESCSLFPVLYTVKAGIGRTGQIMMLKISAPSKRRGSSSAIIICIVVGLSLFVCLTCAGRLLVIRRRRRNEAPHDELFLHDLPRLPPRFSYREMQLATNDFSKELGAGGFGSVYQGVLASNGAKVAVKRLDRGGAAQSMDQFRAEVATIGSVSHVNLVILKGFCMEGAARLLVYEFMANGSLDRWLFRKRKREDEGENDSPQVLDWETRRRIALHTARALEYLHHQCAERIVHCDVKPENILLDEKFNAKVADFGLAKLIGADNQSFAMTTLKGTRGYLAPEWLQHTTITAKSDVYSYGVVLLQLISGRRCLDAERGYLPSWALSIACKGPMSTNPTGEDAIASNIDIGQVEAVLLDEELRGENVPPKELERVLVIGLACVNVEPEGRPTMESVVQMLEGLLDVGQLAEGLRGYTAAGSSSASAGITQPYDLLHSDVLSLSSVMSHQIPYTMINSLQGR